MQRQNNSSEGIAVFRLGRMPFTFFFFHSARMGQTGGEGGESYLHKSCWPKVDGRSFG